MSTQACKCFLNIEDVEYWGGPVKKVRKVDGKWALGEQDIKLKKHHKESGARDKEGRSV